MLSAVATTPAFEPFEPLTITTSPGFTARAISGASRETIERHIANCTSADPAYGAGVRAAIDALNAGEAPRAGSADLESGPDFDGDLL